MNLEFVNACLQKINIILLNISEQNNVIKLFKIWARPKKGSISALF